MLATIKILFICTLGFSVGVFAEDINPNSGRLAFQLFEGVPVPESFEKLIDMVQKKLKKIYAPASILVEKEKIDGRSLDQDYDSVTWARRIVSFQVVQEEPRSSFVPLFIGYAPKRGRLEIISFASGKGYEFLLIDNFAPNKIGNKMNLSTDQIALCSSCHQAGAPIFSKFPWNETEGTDHRNLFSDARNIFKTSNEKLLVKIERIPLREVEAIDGIFQLNVLNRFNDTLEEKLLFDFADDGRRLFSAPLDFDRQVRNSNRGIQIVHVLNRLCTVDDIRCKKIALLLLTLNSFKVIDFNDNFTLKGPRQEFLNIVTNKWDYKNHFAYTSSVLPDRNLDIGTEGTINWKIPVNSKPEEILKRIYDENSSGVGLQFVQGEPIILDGYRNIFRSKDGAAVQNPGNPQLKRPLINPLFLPDGISINSKPVKVLYDNFLNANQFTNALTSFWSQFFENGLVYYFGIFNSKLKVPFSLNLDGYTYSILNDEKISSILSEEIFDSALLINRINEIILVNSEPTQDTEIDIGSRLAATFSGFLTESNPSIEEKPNGISPVKIDLQQVTDAKERHRQIKKLAFQFCSACHGVNSELKLPLDDPKALSQYKSQLGKLAFNRIKDIEMPPSNYKDILKTHFAKEHPDLEMSLHELSEYLRQEYEANLN